MLDIVPNGLGGSLKTGGSNIENSNWCRHLVVQLYIYADSCAVVSVGMYLFCMRTMYTFFDNAFYVKWGKGKRGRIWWLTNA